MSKKAPKQPKAENPAGTRAEKIAAMLQCNTGATPAEVVKATGWQEHGIRGFMSGTLKKKQGIAVPSTRDEGRPHRYFIDRAAL